MEYYGSHVIYTEECEYSHSCSVIRKIRIDVEYPKSSSSFFSAEFIHKNSHLRDIPHRLKITLFYRRNPDLVPYSNPALRFARPRKESNRKRKAKWPFPLIQVRIPSKSPFWHLNIEVMLSKRIFSEC